MNEVLELRSALLAVQAAATEAGTATPNVNRISNLVNEAFLSTRAFPELREVTDQQTPDLFYFDIIGERTFTIAPLSNTALDLRLTYVPVLPDLSADTDELEMPHPLYMAVEAFATASAQIMDRDQTAAIWENVGRERVAAAIGAHARQTQDPEFVQSALSDYTGW